MFRRKKKSKLNVGDLVDALQDNPERIVVSPRCMAKTSKDGQVVMLIFGDYRDQSSEQVHAIFKEALFKI